MNDELLNENDLENTEVALTLSLPFDMHHSLWYWASQVKNCSIEQIAIDAIDDYLNEKFNSDEYKKWVENRVMTAYKNLSDNPNQGVNSNEVRDAVLAKIQARQNH